MAAAPRTIRPAGPGDVAGLRALLAAHGNDGPVVPDGVDVVGPYVRHLVAQHRVLLTEEAGDAVAFGAVVDTGRCLMLSDLFVHPDRLGRGLGRPLLAALFGTAERRATFASADPRALPVYVRAGMTPLWVNLYLDGASALLPDPAPELAVRAMRPGEGATLEAAWLGAGREADHAYWAAQPGADAFVVEERGGVVAIGYARARQASAARALDRLVVRPGIDPVAPAVEALRRAGGPGGPLHACVPGPNPLLPVLLESGFRIVDQDQYLASHTDIVDPVRLLPNPGLL